MNEMKERTTLKYFHLFKPAIIILFSSILLTGCAWEVIHKLPTQIITTKASPATGGTVTGGGEYEVGSTVTLTAIPNDGFVFDRWEDYTRSATRKIVVLATDKTYTAYFK